MSFMVIYASATGEHYDDNDMRLQNCEVDYGSVYRKSVACGDTWRTIKHHGARFVFIAANRANVINITMSGACDAPAVKKKGPIVRSIYDSVFRSWKRKACRNRNASCHESVNCRVDEAI